MVGHRGGRNGEELPDVFQSRTEVGHWLLEVQQVAFQLHNGGPLLSPRLHGGTVEAHAVQSREQVLHRIVAAHIEVRAGQIDKMHLVWPLASGSSWAHSALRQALKFLQHKAAIGPARHPLLAHHQSVETVRSFKPGYLIIGNRQLTQFRLNQAAIGIGVIESELAQVPDAVNQGYVREQFA